MRLIDCFTELMTYTGYFIDSLKSEHPSFDETTERYRQLLERANACGREGGFSSEEWKEGLFAVSAWIDESLLCSEWSERGKWGKNQLQRVHFNTTRAGEEFFVRLAAMDENARAVREVYDYCLALGFKGRFFRPEDENALGDIEEGNLSFVAENPSLPMPEAVFPAAYGKPGPMGKKGLGISIITILFVAGPVIIFALLLSLYGNILENMIASYFR